MKKITTILLGCIAMIYSGSAGAQTARVQAVHNCADLAAATVDVYVNGALFIDDFAFRTASPFVTVPAGVPLSIDIAPGNSSSSAQSIYNLTTTLSSDQTYILVANGIVSTAGYAPNQPFEISVFAQGRESASNPSHTDILVNHGSTDAPAVDVVETSVPAGTIIDNLSYPSFTSGYLELPTADYVLNVTDASGSVVVASYAAPLQTLGLGGAAVTVLASGFLDPSQNSNGPAFGLWAALPAGGALVPLPLVENARVQVIHNCADLVAATVDVYIDGVLALDDFAFRTATPFIDLPAGVPLTIAVAPGNSTSSSQSLYSLTATLTANETYVLVANGIVSPSGYSPSQPFELTVFAQAREAAASASNTDILVNHGSTDAPTVDVVETSVPAGTVIDNLSYPSFTSGYLELPTADYVLNVTDASGSVVVASYVAPLQTLGLQGAAVTVLASGFLDPSQNSNGPAFGLWAALPTGGALVPLPVAPLAVSQFAPKEVKIYPNPVSEDLHFEIPGQCAVAAATVSDANGRVLISQKDLRTPKLNVSGLAAGIYMLNIKLDNASLVRKIVVSR